MLSLKERRAAKAIERAIAKDHWSNARLLLRRALAKKPHDHWLLSRLALTYYEQRKYQRALKYDAMALQIQPLCPLAIWGYAGTLDMLERRKEALQLYRWLISRGEDDLAFGQCGEGLRKARLLIVDCFYRIARIQEQNQQRKRAIAAYKEHISRRKNGAGSIYPLRSVQQRLKNLETSERS